MFSVGDWNQIIDEIEAERFVGREQELEFFQHHIKRIPPRYLIFYITGQGGVGKSTLLNRYREISEGLGFLLSDCNEQQKDVPAVLGCFAQQLSDQGFLLKRFYDRYKTYRQKMDEIESDPKAPQGLAALLGRTLVLLR
jgi:AAA+ ATPase superfamily predicted ATPase